MSERITVDRRPAADGPADAPDDDGRRPSFAIVRTGTDISVRFAGIPLGHEFTSLVLALLQVGGHPSTASDDVIEQVARARRPLRLRDLLLAVLPELPRRRAGAQPHVRAEPEDQPHRDRRRPLPGRGRRSQGDGRPLRVPQRRAVRPGPDDPRADRRQARHRCRRAGGGGDRRQGPVRRPRRRRRAGRRDRGHLRVPQGHPHRRRGRALRRPGARHHGHRELRVRAVHRRSEAGHRARAARHRVRRRPHQAPAGQDGSCRPTNRVAS